jgi:hypothetical protein
MSGIELLARVQPSGGRLIRMPAAASPFAAAGLLLLLSTSWVLTVPGGGAHDATWLAVAAICVLAGCAGLGWLRPASVGLTAPQLMLLLGAAGMVAGLWLDTRSGGFATLAALCLSRPGDLAGTLALHWGQLPLMHLGMLTGGLATVPLLRSLRQGCRRQFCARLAQNLICSGWMVMGMATGTLAFMDLASRLGDRGPAAMLAGMFGGMVWGMVASVAMYRVWIVRYGRA